MCWNRLSQPTVMSGSVETFKTAVSTIKNFTTSDIILNVLKAVSICLLTQIKQKLCYSQIRIFQNSILHLMEELFLLQILTNIWDLHLAAMLNGMYMLKIYC